MGASQVTRTKALAVFEAFQLQGAKAIEADILQPAETLLDLYGETIRNRAYVTSDPVRGEMMLRPDFTVPVVQMHMRDGAEPARYTYMGDVFRKQYAGSDRPAEFLQVGYEVFDRSDPATADAEVFAVLQSVSGIGSLRSIIGDIGILRAAVQGLDTSESRKAALMRHIWRPNRFSNLLQRFSAPALARVYTKVEARHIGLRSEIEISARHAILEADAKEEPLLPDQVSALAAILGLRAPAAQALTALRQIAEKIPAISSAVEGYASRLAALEMRADLSGAMFEGSYGRTSLEYYDGFVFGFYADIAGWPPVAGGGRYDALTRVLGQGRSIPAVGGVLRPELLTRLEAAR